MRLAPAPGQPIGRAALLQLAPDRLLTAEVEVAHQLLGQGRAPLGDAARSHIRESGAQHGQPVGAARVVEAAIFDRDSCLRQLPVDPAYRYRLVIDGGT